jgi:DNA-binding response OmpR family regulator
MTHDTLADASARFERALTRLDAASERIGECVERFPKTRELAIVPLPVVLVVEDDPAVTRGYLRQLGDVARLVVAKDATDALEIATREPVDLLLTDSIGRPAVEALRARGSRLPVLVVSGWDPDPAWAHLASEWLAKPPGAGELEAAVGRLARGGGT